MREEIFSRKNVQIIILLIRVYTVFSSAVFRQHPREDMSNDMHCAHRRKAGNCGFSTVVVSSPGVLYNMQKRRSR